MLGCFRLVACRFQKILITTGMPDVHFFLNFITWIKELTDLPEEHCNVLIKSTGNTTESIKRVGTLSSFLHFHILVTRAASRRVTPSAFETCLNALMSRVIGFFSTIVYPLSLNP